MLLQWVFIVNEEKIEQWRYNIAIGVTIKISIWAFRLLPRVFCVVLPNLDLEKV